jgi:hypothetical protein
MQSTEEQIKKFWEWCGLRPDILLDKSLPPIDLNNLFKWAVPKLHELGDKEWIETIEFTWFGTVRCTLYPFDLPEIYVNDEDPALALFWAIWKVLDERSNN